MIEVGDVKRLEHAEGVDEAPGVEASDVAHHDHRPSLDPAIWGRTGVEGPILVTLASDELPNLEGMSCFESLRVCESFVCSSD